MTANHGYIYIAVQTVIYTTKNKHLVATMSAWAKYWKLLKSKNAFVYYLNPYYNS